MADEHARIARRAIGVALALAAFGFCAAAIAQGTSKPQSVDDIISNVLKDNKDANGNGRSGHSGQPIIMGVRIGEHQDRDSLCRRSV